MAEWRAAASAAASDAALKLSSLRVEVGRAAAADAEAACGELGGGGARALVRARRGGREAAGRRHDDGDGAGDGSGRLPGRKERLRT